MTRRGLAVLFGSVVLLALALIGLVGWVGATELLIVLALAVVTTIAIALVARKAV